MSKTLIILKVTAKSLAAFVLTLFLQLVSIIVLPIVLLFVKKESETLPNAFAWFDNAEIRLGIGAKDDGLAGYPGYRAEMIPKYGLYLTRYIWLAFRNPVNYFQYNVLGAVIYADNCIKDTEYYDAGVGNKEGDHEGLSILSLHTVYGKTRTDVYYVKKLTSTRCIRIRIGHKLKDPSFGGLYLAQFVFTINFAEYEGT